MAGLSQVRSSLNQVAHTPARGPCPPVPLRRRWPHVAAGPTGPAVRRPCPNSIIAQSSGLSLPATSARSSRRLLPTNNATSSTRSASVAYPRDLGWQACGRGTQAERRSTSAAAQTTRCTRHSPALARDPARYLGPPFTPPRGHLAGCQGCHPSVEPRVIPDRSFLGAARSSSLDRRGRLACRAQARTVGTGGPDCQGD
jgi:hypothetical protein